MDCNALKRKVDGVESLKWVKLKISEEFNLLADEDGFSKGLPNASRKE